MIIRSQYPSPRQLRDTDVVTLLLSRAKQYSNKTALINTITDERFTYQNLIDNVKQTASSLYYDYKLRKSDVILILLPNCPEFLIIVLGALSIGVVVSCASHLCTESMNYIVDEVMNYLNETRAKYVVTTGEQHPKVVKVCQKLNYIYDIFVVGESSLGGTSFTRLLQSNTHIKPPVTVMPSDIAMLPFSSGTTGKPKGVMLTHLNLMCYLTLNSAPGVVSMEKGAVVLLYLPLYHIYGISQSLMALYIAGCVLTMPRYELQTFVSNVRRYKPTLLPIVPPTLVQLTKNATVRAGDFESVRVITCGGAPITQEIETEFKTKFARQIFRVGYGLTETTAGLVRTPPDGTTKPGSSGKLIPGMEVRIVDIDTGKDCYINKDGEIWCRGSLVMKGYFGRSQETSQVLDLDGWFRTGDIGHVDEDGYFFVVDRLKELIKYNAFQIAPAELEGILLGHPCIADCAVIGVPHTEAGELPRAYVVLKPRKRASGEQIQDFLAAQVSPAKRLRGGVIFADVIPKSPSGKILRRVLKEQIKTEMISKL